MNIKKEREMNDNEKLEKYNINTKIIAKTLKEKQYTLERFSKLSNIDINILQEILKNNKKVPLYYLVKIGRLLNISYSILFILSKKIK